MKKFVTLMLALAILCTCSVALADGESHATPYIGTFATMKTKQIGNVIYITLSKPVDRLFANWLGYKEMPEELALTEDNEASVLTNGHKYQIGVHWTNWYWKLYGQCQVIDATKTDNEIACQIAQFQLDNAGSAFPCVEIELPVQIRDCETGELLPSPISRDGSICSWRQVFGEALASPYDRAYITVQGDWIVCYNRRGDIVNIHYNDGEI